MPPPSAPPAPLLIFSISPTAPRNEMNRNEIEIIQAGRFNDINERGNDFLEIETRSIDDFEFCW